MGMAQDTDQLPTKAQRARLLRAARRRKMARSAHAFVRGSTAQFYAWLGEAGGARMPQGPSIWICGDCHTGNLGPIAGADGKVAVQIRDLDQTVVGNPAHDLMRLGLSLAMASRSSNLPGVITALMAEQLVDGYREGLLRRAPKTEAEPAPREVRRVLRQSLRRRWQDLARERIDDPTPRIPPGPKFWPLSERERTALTTLIEGEAVRKLVTLLKDRAEDAEVRMLDAAYWVKGCSSLGRLRYAVLAQVGRGRAADTCLIDIKEATDAAAPHASGVEMPRSDAARVVRGARALSPHLGDRMLPARLLRRPVVLRELTPQDLKLEFDLLTQADAARAARYLAAVVGRSHARQMSLATRKAWARDLGRGHSKSLEAPSWLWVGLVDLVGVHESAYLDFCRTYALQDEAP